MGLNDYILKKIPIFMGKYDAKRIAVYKVNVEGVAEFCNIPYLDSGHKYHTLDVYYPQGTQAPLPIIIDVHGGGWLYGEKEINKPYCLTLAAQGFVVVNINYRLMPEVSFPDNLKDIFAAFSWVENHAKDFYGDLNNIYLMGDSAGGHLVAMALSAIADPALAGLFGVSTNLRFNAASLNCPAVNLEKFAKYDKIPLFKFFHIKFLGKDYKTSPLLKHLSVHNNKLEDFPPLFIITNQGDFLRRQVFDFVKECEKRSVVHEFRYTLKKDSPSKQQHVGCMLYPDYPDSVDINNAMLAFFRKYAK